MLRIITYSRGYVYQTGNKLLTMTHNTCIVTGLCMLTERKVLQITIYSGHHRMWRGYLKAIYRDNSNQIHRMISKCRNINKVWQVGVFRSYKAPMYIYIRHTSNHSRRKLRRQKFKKEVFYMSLVTAKWIA